jgi:hypothetical protein
MAESGIKRVGDENMEFKFSCKWFEIAFSGDPGFVETQIEKYEPFILLALKRMEHEADKDDEPGAFQQKAETSHQKTAEKTERQDQHKGRNRRPWDKKKRVKPSAKPDFGVADRERGNHSSDHPAAKVATETGSPADAATDNGPVPLKEARAPDSSSEENSSPSSPEFPARRRTPKILADQLAEIVEEKKPRTHHDRIMVFGYYMEHEGGGSDFTIAEIKKCYQTVSQDSGVNIEQVINHATRSGFIVSHNKGRAPRFKLSNKGRRYVGDGLKLS